MTAPTAIGLVAWRSHVTVRGRVRSMRIVPLAATTSLELVLYDDSGGLIAAFSGRDHIPGVQLGSTVEVEGRAGMRHGTTALLNPRLTILPDARTS